MPVKKEYNLTEEECKEWRLNKTRNPRTNAKINIGKGVYKQLLKECENVKTPILDKEDDSKELKDDNDKKDNIIKVKISGKEFNLDKDKCIKFLKANKLKNPFTNFTIGINSPIRKTIELGCDKLGITKLSKDIDDDKPKDDKPKDDKPKDDKPKDDKPKDDKPKDDKPKDDKPKEVKNKRYRIKGDVTDDICLKWKKNKLRNPLTKSNSAIVKDGPIYNEFTERCSHIETPKMKTDKDIETEKEEKIKKEEQERKKEIEERKKKDEEEKKMKEREEKDKKEKEEDEKKRKEFEEKKKIIEEKKIKEIEENKDRNELYYPELDDIHFNEKILKLKEIRVHNIKKYNDINNIHDFENKSLELCKGFDKSSFQYLIAHYLSYRTPYKSLLLYYSVGVGKTCTAITIAEGLLYTHSSNEEPMIWVILPNAIEAGFKRQIFDTMKITDFKNIANQCTGETYMRLAQITEDLNQKDADKRIKKIIKSRYQFFTYEGFASYIEINYIQKNKIVNNKLIIIDEAHNIRSSDEDENKRVYNALLKVTETGINNRLVFLTATPMYNEPIDIYHLFLLLLKNDKREHLFSTEKIFDKSNNLNPNAVKFISLMSSNYISYLRGKNPFNFAFKLSPRLSGYNLLSKVIQKTEFNLPISESDKNWLDNVEDGIITSELGKKQIEYLSSKAPLKEEGEIIKNNFNALQPMNIVYDKSIGKVGFNNIFIKVNESDQIIVRYNDKYKNILSPDKDHLGLYSGKFLLLSEIIRKTKGIILIYSRYIYSGVMPIAVMLEHMGFSRLNTDNILDKPNITHNATYEGIENPKYCILSSSDPEIMGNTTIDSLMKVINSSSNKNGELVKIVLMTPVAGEGLNFMGIREIHLLESWYHFNRVDQIIGRGIRNCSHKHLPIEERNVTVFMHCGINGYENETADIHAFRISARKLHQTYLIDEIIRNNAIDCSLFKSINYFSKDLFKLGKIDIVTSQGVKVEYELGDNEKFKPVCKVDIDKIKEDSLGYREETYKHLSLNIKNKIKDLILEGIKNNERFYSYDYLKEFFNDIDINILLYAIKLSVYPNILIDNILVLPHEDGIHIIDVIEDKPLKLKLVREEKEEEVIKEIKIDDKFYKKIEELDFKNKYNNAIVSLYRSLDEITFKSIINKLFEIKELNKIDQFIEDCFIREGIIITKKEIPNYSTDYKHIGFVNIYSDEFEPLLYSSDGNYKNFTPKLLDTIKENRTFINKPDDLSKETVPWGLFLPVFENKEKKNKINTFKLLTTGTNYGKKTGIVCTSLQKKDHSKIYKELKLDDSEKNTKESYCFKIAIELFNIKRLTLLPEYKPKYI